MSSRVLELIHCSPYVVILKEPFPKYPKTLKIPQYIEIPLEAQKRNHFNYLSKRSRELIQVFGTVQRVGEQHLALFGTVQRFGEQHLALFGTVQRLGGQHLALFGTVQRVGEQHLALFGTVQRVGNSIWLYFQ